MRSHGEGTITQRKDGRWQAQISIGGGKRKTFYGKTRKEVREKLRVAINEQKAGTLILAPNQTLEVYLTYWLEKVAKLTIRPRSYEQYLSVLNAHLIPGLGKIELQKLTFQQVQDFYARLYEEGLAARSINAIHAVLRRALNHAVKHSLVARNVATFASRPTARRYKPQVLTEEQANKLIEAVKGQRIEAFIILALTTAARRSELLALHWDDIDFTLKAMRIERSLTHSKGRGVYEGETKTEASRRTILLADIAIDVLQEHHVKQNELRLERLESGETWIDKGLVFCGAEGDYLAFETVRRLFSAALRDASLPHIRLHDLRHSAATLLLVKGVHPKVVQELLGHSNISMTMDVYSHVLPSMQQVVTEKMNDVFKRP